MYLRYALLGIIPTMIIGFMYPFAGMVYMLLYICLVDGKESIHIRKKVKAAYRRLSYTDKCVLWGVIFNAFCILVIGEIMVQHNMWM